MTLLTTLFVAILTTIFWYKSENRSEFKLGVLCLMYWGASLMWLVDAVVEYFELHEAYFSPDPADMLNDLYLGLSVIALGLIIWLVIVLIKDPKGIVKKALTHK